MMRKPIWISVTQRAQDGTTLSRMKICIKDEAAPTVQGERLVSSERTEQHRAATRAFLQTDLSWNRENRC